jgi:hypothetical protein
MWRHIVVAVAGLTLFMVSLLSHAAEHKEAGSEKAPCGPEIGPPPDRFVPPTPPTTPPGSLHRVFPFEVEEEISAIKKDCEPEIYHLKPKFVIRRDINGMNSKTTFWTMVGFSAVIVRDFTADLLDVSGEYLHHCRMGVREGFR